MCFENKRYENAGRKLVAEFVAEVHSKGDWCKLQCKPKK